MLLGELFTPNAKKVIAPIGKGFNLFLAFIIGLVFPFLVGAIGIAGTFFIFMGFSVVSFFYAFIVIPETKGRTFSEIQKMLDM